MARLLQQHRLDNNKTDKFRISLMLCLFSCIKIFNDKLVCESVMSKLKSALSTFFSE